MIKKKKNRPRVNSNIQGKMPHQPIQLHMRCLRVADFRKGNKEQLIKIVNVIKRHPNFNLLLVHRQDTDKLQTPLLLR